MVERKKAQLGQKGRRKVKILVGPTYVVGLISPPLINLSSKIWWEPHVPICSEGPGRD